MLALRWPKPLTDDIIVEIAAANPALRIERSAKGELVLMPPLGMTGGRAESDLNHQLASWVDEHGGCVFSSNAGFNLPNTALRSPDAAYVTEEHWQAVPPEERRRFAHLVPDAAFELRSRTDSLRDLRRKLDEYVACGVTLVVLLDPKRKVVEIRRHGAADETHTDPDVIELGPPLEGFKLNVRRIFERANE
jgi:Uma2 family endonuclease